MHILLHSVTPTLHQASPNPSLHWRHLTLLESESVSCGVTVPFSWILVCTRFCLCPPRVYFPVLCKLGQLYGGVNGGLLQEGLCHTHVCCTQSPCSCCSALLIHTSIGDAQIQFCLSFCAVSGSWCTQGLFEPSEHLWWEWSLILNANSSCLPSCWDFSFVLGHVISSQSCSSAMQSPLQCLSSGWGFYDLGGEISLHGCSSTTQPPLQRSRNSLALKYYARWSLIPAISFVICPPSQALPWGIQHNSTVLTDRRNS